MRRIVPWLFLFLAIACQEPLSTEEFIPGGGPYVFTVDLSDTTAAYDFDLYTRLDGDPEDLYAVKGTLLRAEWRSPSDSIFVEKIYLPLTGTRKSYFSRQVYEPYRADVRPVQPGQWTITFRQEDRSQVVPFRGLGLVVRRVMPDNDISVMPGPDRASETPDQVGGDKTL